MYGKMEPWPQMSLKEGIQDQQWGELSHTHDEGEIDELLNTDTENVQMSLETIIGEAKNEDISI